MKTEKWALKRELGRPVSIPMQNTRAFSATCQLAESLGSRQAVRHAWDAIELSPDMILGGSAVYIPYRIQAAFLEAAARATGIEHFGALCGSYLSYTQLDSYSRYVLAAPTLGQAFVRGTRALRYIISNCAVHVSQRGDYVCLQFDNNLKGVVGARHVDEAMPLLLADLIRRFAGREWIPEWIELPLPKWTPTGAIEDIYETEVRLGAKLPGIVLHKSLLALENPMMDQTGGLDLLRDVRDMVRRPAPASVRDMTRNTIELQLRNADATIESVAETLGMGVRTLQRQLLSESTNFQECLGEIRTARASDMLRETRLPVAQIASQLGYQETNAFRRAFRRWTGVSPNQFRKQAFAQ